MRQGNFWDQLASTIVAQEGNLKTVKPRTILEAKEHCGEMWEEMTDDHKRWVIHGHDRDTYEEPQQEEVAVARRKNVDPLVAALEAEELGDPRLQVIRKIDDMLDQVFHPPGCDILHPPPAASD